MWILVISGGLILAIITSFVIFRGRYYRGLFSAESFREFHQGLSKGITAATSKAPNQTPSPDDATAFVTSFGLAAGVTSNIGEDGRQTLHISMSQPGQITTHTVCSRFGFFTIVMFGGLKAELSPYYTESGVHHLVFRFETVVTSVLDFDAAYARYLKDYRAVPFQQTKLKSE
jgi:hypothetical protein